MMTMKIFLIPTPVNCFRSPAVLGRIREGLREGHTVAISTRDHPETLPDGVVHAGDDWSAVVSAGPDLAVFDNLTFDDARGRDLRRWDDDEGRYLIVPTGTLEAVLGYLKDLQTKEVLLVCEEAEISDGWREWMGRHDVIVLDPEPAPEWFPCRRWWLADARDAGERYRYREGRLLKPVQPAFPRLFEAEIRTPAAEALLALTAEYAAVRYENQNPEDPRGLNQRDDMCHEIMEAFAGAEDPRVILSAMEDLYDIVSDHVDFARWKPSWKKSGNSGTSDEGGNHA